MGDFSKKGDIHDESRSSRSSVVSYDLVNLIDDKIRQIRRFAVSELSQKFPNVSRIVLYKMVNGNLGYRKFCAQWIPKILTAIH